VAVAKVESGLCEKCAVCNAMLACPIDAIIHYWSEDLVRNGPVEIDQKRCLGCGKCESFCRGGAIKIDS